MPDVFRTLVVTEACAPLARSIANAMAANHLGPHPTDEDGNPIPWPEAKDIGMWTTGLSADGAEPATHFVSTGYVPADFAYLVPCQTWEWQGGMGEPGQWVMTGEIPGDPLALYQIAVNADIACTQADIDALFATSDVTEQEPFTAFGRLGLQIVQTPMV